MLWREEEVPKFHRERILVTRYRSNLCMEYRSRLLDLHSTACQSECTRTLPWPPSTHLSLQVELSHPCRGKHSHSWCLGGKCSAHAASTGLKLPQWLSSKLPPQRIACHFSGIWWSSGTNLHRPRSPSRCKGLCHLHRRRPLCTRLCWDVV